MKRAIVTGATSFIGINLIKGLLRGGYEVTGVVRPGSTKKSLLPTDKYFRIIESDLSNYSSLHESIVEQPDVFFSLAWNGTRGEYRDNTDLQYYNYKYSIEGLKSILKTGCKKIITAGSQAQYGIYNQKITEKTLENPVTQYGKYKLKFYYEAKNICEDLGIRLKEPRFFSLYGPNDFENTMIISTIRLMMDSKPCPFTLGIQMWDFLYITDAINALICLEKMDCEDGVYNLGSGISKPLKEYIVEIQKILHSNSELLFGAIPYPETGMVSIEPDISKIIEQTGWYPQVPFEKGITEVIKSIKE